MGLYALTFGPAHDAGLERLEIRMFAEISGALGAAKAILEVSKAVSDVSKQAELVGLTLEFNQKLLELAGKCNQLADENQSLKRSVAKLKDELQDRNDFAAEALTYELQEVGIGVFAYVAKGTTNPNESTRKYCANCFPRRKLSLLQQSSEPSRQIGLSCNDCISTMVFSHYISR